MFREKLPIVIRKHLAEMSFNKDTYKAIFLKADQVYDSNRASEPLPGSPVAAVAVEVTNPPKAEVVAVEKSQSGQGNDKNKTRTWVKVRIKVKIKLRSQNGIKV